MNTYRERDEIGNTTLVREYVVDGQTEQVQTGRALMELVPTTLFGTALFLDGELQFTEKDEYIYHEMLVHPTLLAAQQRNNICIFGGGDGLAAREVLRWREVEHIDLVDWDQEVVEHFSGRYSFLNQNSFQDPRCEVHIADVASFSREEHQYDAIIIDLVDPDANDGASVNLWEDILNGVRRWLRPGGSLVINAGGFLPWQTETLQWLVRRVCQAFRGVAGYSIQAYKVFVPSFGREWCYFLIAPSQSFPLSAQQIPSSVQPLRYFDQRAWLIASTWTCEFQEILPTEPVNLIHFLQGQQA